MTAIAPRHEAALRLLPRIALVRPAAVLVAATLAACGAGPDGQTSAGAPYTAGPTAPATGAALPDAPPGDTHEGDAYEGDAYRAGAHDADASGTDALDADAGTASATPDATPDASPMPEPAPEPMPPSAPAPSAEPAPADPTPPAPLSRAAARERAMTLWRNGDPSRHPKGSCAGCHGADFFDLARIGSTDADVVRRATLDGATPDEAEALRAAIGHLREDLALPPTDARAFRPFQPGGAMLLPGLPGDDHADPVRRDIAFGKGIEPRLPTLFGERIDSLEDAHRAARELLDIVEGANEAGANPALTQLRDLPNGIPYPLWSADLHHGEGTLNDWVADVAHEAPPGSRDAWFAVQDRYLDAPTRANFWRMYVAAEELVQTTQFGHCAHTGDYTFSVHACSASRRFSRAKFLSALIGQHQMRVPFDGRAEDLMDERALGFAYLTEDPAFDFMLDRKGYQYLPAAPWDIGDDARVMIHRSKRVGSLREQLGTRGFPGFVVDSVGDARTTFVEEEDLRVAWFWQGFVMDPSFQRIGEGTSRSAEYMVESFNNTNRFVHLSFSAHVRLVAKGFLQEANVERVNRQRHLDLPTPRFRLDYSYFNGYGRPVLRWREDRKAGQLVPDALKDEQRALFHRMTANGYRMSLYLWLESMGNGTEPKVENLDAILPHFDAYQPEHRDADVALLNRVKVATGDPETF